MSRWADAQMVQMYYPPMTPRRKRLTILGAIPSLFLLSIVAGYDYVRGAAFVIQAAGLKGSARTVAEWTTTEVAETESSLPWRGGILRARVYRPSDTNGPPALLIPGVHAGGIDEPRLVQFARDVSSMGRVVVSAELPDLKRYRLGPQTTDMIQDAAMWLSQHSGYAQDGRVGVMGISFAGGLALVAAARPELRDRVAFVMSFGGHGDLPRTLRYLCTGVQPDGTHRAPHDYGVAIILLGAADRVVPPAQAQPLRQAIEAFLHASHVDMVDKQQAKIEFARAREMAARLQEPARTLMTYVNDRNVAKLGPILLPHVNAFGDDANVSPVRAPTPPFPVYLLHGTDDNVIPAVESKLLADVLRQRGAQVQQLATPLITHAEVDRSAAARAMWDLVKFWSDLLDED